MHMHFSCHPLTHEKTYSHNVNAFALRECLMSTANNDKTFLDSSNIQRGETIFDLIGSKK